MKKEPRWVVPFLRALERTGEVRAAAEDAGIDWSTAYQRRKAHADFAAAWAGALEARAARVKAEQEELEALLYAPSPGSPSGGGEVGEELVGAGRQMKRAGPGRWSKASEARFFEELAATANVRAAAAAAGVSPNAVYARRMKQPLFRAKWAAVLETGRAAIEMKLVEAANRSFDPDELDTGGVEPRVSVAEAIRIVQLHGSKVEQHAIADMEPPAEEVEALRERLFNKLQRLLDREKRNKLEAGWLWDESHRHLIPPGWVMGPDYRPKEPVDDAVDL